LFRSRPSRARSCRPSWLLSQFRDSQQGYRFRGRRATGYNRAMSMATGGRVGVVVLLLLVAAVVALPLLPGDPAAIRLAGVGALWLFTAWAAFTAPLTACSFLRPPTNVPASRSDTTVTTT